MIAGSHACSTFTPAAHSPAEPIWVRTESQEPAMTHFGREPVMATSSSAPSMAAVTRRREYGELVQEPVAPPG